VHVAGSRDGGNHTPWLSFVIPALDEANQIATTLGSIERHVPAGIHYECILVDHGSRDRTREIARAAGARVIEQRGGTIASLRNRGASSARSPVLVFLDADVTLTDDWSRALPATIEALREAPMLVTGSHCMPPSDASWLERYWFQPFADDRKARYIGSGHLIVTRSLFDAVGGFDALLETGEDFDFSRRALAAGGRIENRPDLRVEHHGFPRTLGAFVRREIWHGRGDVASLRLFFRSKVALGALSFVVLHAVLLVGLNMPALQTPLAPAALGGLAALLVASTVYRCRGEPVRTIAINFILFYFYYLGRALALFAVICRLSAPGKRLRIKRSSIS
jgi:glycosyltransferase involved in cell wall biosynthesis